MATKATPSMAIADIPSGRQPMTARQARDVTDQIKRSSDNTWDLIVKAYLGQAWQALQHPTEGRKYTDWDDYVDGEFADAPISLPREKRKEAVLSLRSHGLSARAIAPLVGAGKSTVQRDIDNAVSTVPSGTAECYGDSMPPLDVDTEPLPGQQAIPPVSIQGRDGKSHPATRQRQPKSKDQDIVAFATKLAIRLDMLNADMDKLFELPGARESVEVERLLRNRIESLSNAVEMYMQPTEVTAQRVRRLNPLTQRRL